MQFEVSFKVNLIPEQRELLELHLENTLKLLGLKPKDLIIALREKPDPIPAQYPKNLEE